MQTLADAIAEIDALKAALYGLSVSMLQTGLLDQKKLDSSINVIASANPSPNGGGNPSAFLQFLLNLSS